MTRLERSRAITLTVFFGLLLPSVALGVEIGCGDHTGGEVSSGEEDRYTFSGDAGDVVAVMFLKESGVSTFTPILDLGRSGAGAEPLATDSFGLNDFVLPETGEYTLRVRPRGASAETYFLSLEWLAPLADQCSSESLSPGATVEGALGDGRSELYTFSAASGDTVVLELEGTGGDLGFTPAFELFGPDPATGPVASGNAGSHESILQEDGTYTLRVHQTLVRDRNNAFRNLRGTYSLGFSVSGAEPRETRFVRGDGDADGRINITDAVVILRHRFAGTPATLECEQSADVDANGDVELTDAVALLQYLFGSGSPPEPPFPSCGVALVPAAAERLDCSVFPPCRSAAKPGSPAEG